MAKHCDTCTCEQAAAVITKDGIQLEAGLPYKQVVPMMTDKKLNPRNRAYTYNPQTGVVTFVTPAKSKTNRQYL